MITYIPYIHRSTFQDVESKALIKYEQSLSTNSQFYQWLDNKYTLQTTPELFPSRNFIMMQNIVETYILSTELLGNYNVSSVLINGIAGLGKSRVIHYLTRCNSARYLYRADLNSVELLKMPLDKLFRAIFFNLTIEGSTVIMIDEIDKWVSYQEQESYRLMRTKLAKEIKSNDAITEIPTFESHSKYFRMEFLNQLLAILEKTGHGYPCMVIFCCNNFDTIFGNMDMKHYHSLNDRFKRLTFELCQPEEIKDYLRYNNQKFLNSRLRVSSDELEHIFSRIPQRPLTYRKLNEISVLNMSDPVKIVQALQDICPNNNDTVSNTFSSSSSSSTSASSTIALTYLDSSLDVDVGTYTVGDETIIDGNVTYVLRCHTCQGMYPVCCCNSCSENNKDNCHWCITEEKIPFNPTEYIPFDVISKKYNKLCSQCSTGNDNEKKTSLLKLLTYLVQDDVIASCKCDSSYTLASNSKAKQHNADGAYRFLVSRLNGPPTDSFNIDVSVKSNVKIIAAYIKKWRIRNDDEAILSMKQLAEEYWSTHTLDEHI